MALNRDVVDRLVALLTQHDEEEKRLIALARDGTLRYDSFEWDRHDLMERHILFAMADATNEESLAAIDEYDALDPTLI